MPRQKHRAKCRRGRGVCPAPPGPSPSAPPARACKTPAVIPLYTAGRILERRCFSIARNSADRSRALFKRLTNGADDVSLAAPETPTATTKSEITPSPAARHPPTPCLPSGRGLRLAFRHPVMYVSVLLGEGVFRFPAMRKFTACRRRISA